MTIRNWNDNRAVRLFVGPAGVRLLLVGLIAALLWGHGVPERPAVLHAQGAATRHSGALNASDFPDLQAAIDALPGHSGEVYLPAGIYTVNKTINMSHGAGYSGGIKLVGDGRATQIVANCPGQPVFDLTGASECIFEDLRITYNGKPDAAPSIGILIARSKQGGSAQEHRFDNVTFDGTFTIANVYCVMSELDRFNGCIFINKAPNAYNLVWTSDNFANVASPYQGAVQTMGSNTEVRVAGCSFYNWATGPNGANIKMLGFSQDATVRDCYMKPPNGGSAVILGSSRAGGPMQDCDFDNIRVEGEDAGDIFRMQGREEQIAIRNCTVYYGVGFAVNVDNARYLDIQDNHFWNVRGGKHVMRINQFSKSRVLNNMYDFENWGKQPTQPGPDVILQSEMCNFNDIQVTSRNEVDCTNLTGTRIDCQDNIKGTRNYYWGANQQPSRTF